MDLTACPFCRVGRGGSFPNDIGYCRCCQGDAYATAERIAYFQAALPVKRRARS